MSIQSSQTQAENKCEQVKLVPDEDSERRQDLTKLRCYAIDSAQTQDFDDAISWDEENSLAWVHVADITRFFLKA